MTLHALQTRTAAESAFAEQFAALQDAAPALDREASFRAFTAKGLPTRRNEAWHYTDLRALFTNAAPLADAPDALAIAAAKRSLGQAGAGWRDDVGDRRRPFRSGIVERAARGRSRRLAGAV